MSSKVTEKSRCIAFLKGLNVGGHTVKMDNLRLLFEELGFGDVETFIASGNVIFSSPHSIGSKLETEIADHLEAALGYSVPTFIRTQEELSRIADYRPFPEPDLAAEGNSLYIAFLPTSLSPGVVQRVEAASSENDLFRVDCSELYWLCRSRFSDSPFTGPKLEKLLGTAMTVRNSTTVRKIAAKYCV